MGWGSWTRDSFTNYVTTTKCMNVAIDATTGDATIACSCSAQDMFTARELEPMLNPKGVIRECFDTEEHPNTVPVILALDVTGSMGEAAVEVAKKLNVVMTKLYDQISDVEFMIMGIGDLSYDKYPIQASQFESDIRIMEQLDKVYFEFGGGGNSFESYTAAWYFGSRHTKLDCWNRGKKGIIITMGDERLNPYLPIQGRNCSFEGVIGDTLQDNVETKDLYHEASEKFDIYHLDVNHGWRFDDGIAGSFKEYLDDKHFRQVNLDNIADEIVDIIISSVESQGDISSTVTTNENGEISW